MRSWRIARRGGSRVLWRRGGLWLSGSAFLVLSLSPWIPRPR